MKVILTFKKAAFNWDFLFGEVFETLADSTFYGLANVTMQHHSKLKIIIKRLTSYGSIRPCKIIFEGESAREMAYNWIEQLGHKIKNVKVRERD